MAAFTDVEMAILSKAAYYDYPDSAHKQSLCEFLKTYQSDLVNELGPGYEEAIQALIDKVKNQDYTIVKSMNDRDGTGFAAFAIKHPNNEVTVACRGTEGFSMDYDSRKDVIADAQLAFSLQTGQQRKMQEFMDDLQKGNYSGYYFTGHSLGGNLAMYGALCLHDPSKLRRVVTFNAPGFNVAFWTENTSKLARVQDKFTTYQNERDYVSESFTVPGKVVILEDTGDGNAHLLNTLVISSDGESFIKNSTGKKQVTLAGLGLATLTTITDIFMLTLLPGILLIDFTVWGISKIKTWVKSFSEGAKYAASNPKVTVDTYKLRNYAQRIVQVNARISKLDRRLDSLYRSVGLKDLWNLMQADLLTGYSWRLLRCSGFLSDTANDFEKAEESIASALS